MISVKLGINWTDSGAFHLLHKDPLCQESQRTMRKGGNKVKGREAVSRVDLPVDVILPMVLQIRKNMVLQRVEREGK
jgi:hypothetical protein